MPLRPLILAPSVGRPVMFVMAASALFVAACIDVPEGVHAQFAGAGPDDRSNFRKGAHGSAPPSFEDPPAAPVAKEASTDAGAGVVNADASATTAAPAPAAPADAGAMNRDGGAQ